MTDIRQLTEADRQQWLAQRLALWPREDATAFDVEMAATLATPATMVAFGAFEDGRLVGFAEAAERPWGEGCETAPVAWLEGIYIEPEARRAGIGRLLVDAVCNWARVREYQELGSDVLEENAGSLASHANWGFEETTRVVNFRIRL